ncbi:ArsR/SmtB family transcription factor [Streptomyces sp. NPDC058457]|uniref:ArsR/SmtB family transcription factor n=1 Tax=Streptomyces sp. NPDC058457 TaxID=3346507 RepID=UPI00364F4C1B
MAEQSGAQQQSVALTGQVAEGTRFSVSPLWETVSGLRVLARHRRQAVYGRWTAWADEQLTNLRGDRWFRLLLWLLTSGPEVPEFLVVTPGLRSVSIATEIDAVIATPAVRVRAALESAFGDDELPAAVRAAAERPEDTCRRLGERLAACHDALITPIWPRLAGVLEGDVEWRAAQLVEFGVSYVVPRLHDSVRWVAGSIVIGDPARATARPANDRDLVFVPSAFVWPDVYLRYTPHRIALCYPARGFGSLWQRSRTSSGNALQAVLGRNRARLLQILERPATVGELAEQLGITPGAVSQHLALLRAAGLVVSRRTGRETTSLRTALGHALVDGQLPENPG